VNEPLGESEAQKWQFRLIKKKTVTKYGYKMPFSNPFLVTFPHLFANLHWPGDSQVTDLLSLGKLKLHNSQV